MTGEGFDEQFKREVLPDWASAYKPDGELETGRQLCTRDGRRCGNAYITKIAGSIPALVLIVIYEVTTDAGNQMRMTADEIHEIFYVGEYIAHNHTIPGLRNLK